MDGRKFGRARNRNQWCMKNLTWFGTSCPLFGLFIYNYFNSCARYFDNIGDCSEGCLIVQGQFNYWCYFLLISLMTQSVPWEKGIACLEWCRFGFHLNAASTCSSYSPNHCKNWPIIKACEALSSRLKAKDKAAHSNFIIFIIYNTYIIEMSLHKNIGE